MRTCFIISVIFYTFLGIQKVGLSENYYGQGLFQRVFVLKQDKALNVRFESIRDTEDLLWTREEGKLFPLYALRGYTEPNCEISYDQNIFRSDRTGYFSLPLVLKKKQAQFIIKFRNLDQKENIYQVFFDFNKSKKTAFEQNEFERQNLQEFNQSYSFFYLGSFVGIHLDRNGRFFSNQYQLGFQWIETENIWKIEFRSDFFLKKEHQLNLQYSLVENFGLNRFEMGMALEFVDRLKSAENFALFLPGFVFSYALLMDKNVLGFVLSTAQNILGSNNLGDLKEFEVRLFYDYGHELTKKLFTCFVNYRMRKFSEWGFENQMTGGLSVQF